MPAYTLENTSILFDGRKDLTRKKTNEILSKAMRRKMRLEGYDAAFRKRLDETGYATLTWHFTRFNHNGERYWVTIEAEQQGEDIFRVSCTGPASKYTVERINKAIIEPKRAKQKRAQQNLQRVRNRKQAARNQRLKQHRERQGAQVQKKKERRRYPAAFSHKTKDVVWQFSHNIVTWKEAVEAAVYVFSKKGDGRRSAHQLAASELFRSFDNSGLSFMRMKREQDGFELRFDTLDENVLESDSLSPEQECFFEKPFKLRRNRESIWERFEQTRFSISCTKDNKHPLYARVRRHFKMLLVGLPAPAQKQRRLLLADQKEAA